ncbi:MAG: tetraacyldisaccharide 4'-kinase [Omnitrophica bacterium RIFCSPHIGHO2_02_FULL_51_18]|nr:MAG: tetraacyldisaccharide 4'-kinase [Omnitrophica bacterium RIFCSPHIGHO2_02_FULL_51_18]
MKKILGDFLTKIYKQALLISQAGYRAVPSRIQRVGARVISIGNITWGGTGKTPLAVMLSRELAAGGKKVAILTRGYGDDEVKELKKKLPQVPVVVGRDRVKTAKEAIEKYGAQVLILDDGFQHIRLHRDLDVVNINSTLPFGPGGLIPVGTLREPIEHLSRGHIFVLTKSDIGSKNVHWIRQRLQAIKPNAVIFEARHRPTRLFDARHNQTLELQEIRGKKVAVISGIGDPYSFEKTVENLGAEIVLAARFDDHHRYTESELKRFGGQCGELGVKDIVTTEKDFFRLEGLLKNKKLEKLQALNFFVLQIEFEMNDEEDFIRRCLNS